MTKKKPLPPTQLAALRAHGFKPGGPSPNPGGRPKQHKEMVMKLRAHADYIADAILALIQKGLEGKLTMSDKILSNHLFETWQAMFGRHPQSVLLSGGLDVGDIPGEGTNGLSMLLQRARLENAKRGLPKEVPAPPALTPAEAEISPLQAMLAQVRNTTPDGRLPPEREVLENLLGKDRAADLIGQAAIVVDSTGTAVAAPPPEGAAAAPSSAAEGAPRPEPPPKAPPTARPLKPEPPYQGRDVTPPHLRHPAAASFPAFGEFISGKATADADAARAKKVEAARAQGRPQISAAEAFPPDAREPPEVVRFTRVAGSKGIKRC